MDTICNRQRNCIQGANIDRNNRLGAYRPIRRRPPRIHSGIGSLRFDHVGCRGHDRVWHLYRTGRDGAEHRQRRMASGGLGRGRGAHHRGRAVLRRTVGHDAARWWNVCLLAGGVFAPVWFSLRLDSFFRHRDRHDRGGCCGLRPIHRHSMPADCGRSLLDLACSYFNTIRPIAFDGAIARHRRDRATHLQQHTRPPLREADSEYIHRHEDWSRAGADCSGNFAGAEPCSHAR